MATFIVSIFFGCNLFNKNQSEVYKYIKTYEKLNKKIKSGEKPKKSKENVIIRKGKKDYIVDDNGIEQEILDNPNDCVVGEVFYFGEIEGKKIPFVVVNRKNGKMMVVSIPKFNILRAEKEDEGQTIIDNYERVKYLNEKFINNFSKIEQNKLSEEYYIDYYLNYQYGKDKEVLDYFKINYTENQIEKTTRPIIKLKIDSLYDHQFHQNIGYIDRQNNGENCSMEILDNFNMLLNMEFNCIYKGTKFNYKNTNQYIYLKRKDYVNYQRIILFINVDSTEQYNNKLNGYKVISKDTTKQSGLYLIDGKIVKNKIVSNGSDKYYCDDDGSSHLINDFSKLDIDGISIFTNEKTIARNIIISDEKEYVDYNGIIHKLYKNINEIKEENDVSLVFGYDKEKDEPLVWRVVNNKNGIITLILESELYLKKEHKDEIITTWENSNMRKYLNGEFYENSFSEDEKQKIASNPIRYEAMIFSNDYFGEYQDSTDKVFFFFENTYKYMDDYETYEKKIKLKKNDLYDLINDKINFKLAYKSKDTVKPWIVINNTDIEPKDIDKNKDLFDFGFDNQMTWKQIKKNKTSNKYFGKYYYSDIVDSEKNKLGWSILGMDDKSVYMTTWYTIDLAKINNDNIKTIDGQELKWSNSYLRKWLNEVFINNILSDNEKEALLPINKLHTYIDSNGKINKETCEDYISLLSYDEINTYQNVSSGSFGGYTPYCLNKNIDIKAQGFATSTTNSAQGKFYSLCGNYDEYGDLVDDDLELKLSNNSYIGLRPCICIKKDYFIENLAYKKDISRIVVQGIENGKKFGDIVDFGMYNGTKIEWTILEKYNNYALLMTKKPLYSDIQNGNYGICSWESSNVRKKLNTEFYNNAFNENEKSKIITLKLNTKYNVKKKGILEESNVEDELDILETETIDKVFLPHKSLFNIKFETPLNENLKSNPFWLREGDVDGFFVCSDSRLCDMNKNRKESKYAIRPCIWIELDD